MATSEEERIELALRGFEAYEAADPATVLELLDPEIEIFTSPNFMNSGTFHGHEGFLKWAATWNEAWDSFHIEPKSTHPIGRRHVAIEVVQAGTGRSSGVEIRMEACYLHEVRDGLSVYLGLYPDLATATEAAREREAS